MLIIVYHHVLANITSHYVFTGLSVSIKSVARSSYSPTPSGRLMMDEHKQLKESYRTSEDLANSSDPDTSLYEYEDDK